MTSVKNPGLATLSKLPRELRDAIYRYLVKGGHYGFLNGPLKFFKWAHTAVLNSSTRRPDLALLVSKATCDEFSSIFYADSTFHIEFEWSHTLTYIPEPILRRMMKIELVFGWGELQDCHVRVVNALNSEGTLRDSLTITSHFGPQERGDDLVCWLSKRLEAFNSYRTVTLKINPNKYPSTWSKAEAEQKYITRVIKQE